MYSTGITSEGQRFEPHWGWSVSRVVCCVLPRWTGWKHPTKQHKINCQAAQATCKQPARAATGWHRPNSACKTRRLAGHNLKSPHYSTGVTSEGQRCDPYWGCQTSSLISGRRHYTLVQYYLYWLFNNLFLMSHVSYIYYMNVLSVLINCKRHSNFSHLTHSSNKILENIWNTQQPVYPDMTLLLKKHRNPRNMAT